MWWQRLHRHIEHLQDELLTMQFCVNIWSESAEKPINLSQIQKIAFHRDRRNRRNLRFIHPDPTFPASEDGSSQVLLQAQAGHPEGQPKPPTIEKR